MTTLEKNIIISMNEKGMSVTDISEKLNISRNTVKSYLQRKKTADTYTGNLLLQTTFLENHITKKAMKNEGQLPKYHVEDAHEAIISMEQYLAVQAEINRRTAEYSRNNGKKQIYPFTGKLTCDCCGKHYQRKKTATGYVWICSTFNREGKSARVSTDLEEQVTSYKAQVDYYTKYIKEREDWDFVKVYTDEDYVNRSVKYYR